MNANHVNQIRHEGLPIRSGRNCSVGMHYRLRRVISALDPVLARDGWC
jgi:hypothetical protein